MKIRLIALLGAVCLTAATASIPAQAGTATCSRMVLTGHPSYPPVAWATGETLDGAGIELVRRLAKDAGVGITVVNEGSWDDAQTAVQAGKADAIVGIYLTEKRAKVYDYVTPAFANDPSAVVTRANQAFDASHWDWNNLIGKRVVAGTGESFGHDFDAFAREKLKLRRVDGFDAIYAALRNHLADYGLVGYYPALTDAPKGIKIVVPSFVTEGFYIAFDKSSPCSSKLSAKFSKDITRLMANGTIQQLMEAALKSYSSPSK